MGISYRRGEIGLFGSLCAVAVVLATGIAAGAPRAAREQTLFNLESPVKRPVRLPADVLRGLGTDEKVLALLTDGGTEAKPVPREWFAGSAVHLNNDRLPDLVVQAKEPSLFGANMGPFWVYRNTGKGYGLVLRADALTLEVLPGRTRGFRNIRTQAASARQVFTRDFRYDGLAYRAARR